MSCTVIDLDSQLDELASGGTWIVGKPDVSQSSPCTSPFVFTGSYLNQLGLETNFSSGAPVIDQGSVDLDDFSSGTYFFTYKVTCGSTAVCSVLTVIKRLKPAIDAIGITTNVCESDTTIYSLSDLFNFSAAAGAVVTVELIGAVTSGPSSVNIGSNLNSDPGPFFWQDGDVGNPYKLRFDASIIQGGISSTVVYQLRVSAEYNPGSENCEDCKNSIIFTINVDPLSECAAVNDCDSFEVLIGENPVGSTLILEADTPVGYCDTSESCFWVKPQQNGTHFDVVGDSVTANWSGYYKLSCSCNNDIDQICEDSVVEFKCRENREVLATDQVSLNRVKLEVIGRDGEFRFLMQAFVNGSSVTSAFGSASPNPPHATFYYDYSSLQSGDLLEIEIGGNYVHPETGVLSGYLCPTIEFTKTIS